MKDRSRAISGAAARPSSQALQLIEVLAERLRTTQPRHTALDEVALFERQHPGAQRFKLPALYLSLEDAISQGTDDAAAARKALREQVRAEFAELMSDERFGLIFHRPGVQAFYLRRLYLLAVLEQAFALVGPTGNSEIPQCLDWLHKLPGKATALPAPFGLSMDGFDPDDPAAGRLLIALTERLHTYLTEQLGRHTHRIFESALNEVSRTYARLESFDVIRELMLQRTGPSRPARRTTSRQPKRPTPEAAAIEDQSAAVASVVQLQSILNTINDGIITIDENGVIVLINREAERIWHYPAGELLGYNMAQLLPAEHLPAYQNALERYQSDPAGFPTGWRLELEGLRQNLTRFPLELKFSETRVGGRIMFTAAARDITDQKAYEAQLIRAKEQAEEMSRLKTVFVANVSHEIRTPLTAILGYAAVLGEEVEADQHFLVDHIEDNGRRLMTTLNAVLDLARAEAGELQAAPCRVDLRQALQELLPPLASQAAEKQLAFHVALPEGPVYIETDLSFFSRILANLVGNAIKFTEAGAVSVNLTQAADAVALTVVDTGIGIDEAFMPHLFEEFKQESSGLSRSHQGTGLGLALTHRLVGILQGRIAVESRKGVGTRVTVTLPVADR